jgi:general secretion pathway protein G
MWKWLAAGLAFLIAAAALANQLFGGADHSHSQSQRLRAQLDYLAADLEQYRQDTGTFPRSLQDLLIAPADGLGAYAKPKSLLDPWGIPIQYRRLPLPHRFVVFSLGQDGILGGSGNA